jgi:hypothetical protein
MTFHIMAEFRYADIMLSVIMLNVTYKPFVLSVVMLSVFRLIVVMLSVAAPHFLTAKLNVVMLNAVILCKGTLLEFSYNTEGTTEKVNKFHSTVS